MARRRTTNRKPYNSYPPGRLLTYEPHPTAPDMFRVYVQTQHKHVIPVDVPAKLLTYAHTHHHQLAWCTQQQQAELYAHATKGQPMTASAHMVGYNRVCVHTDQPACAVITRAQLETAADNADHDPSRNTIIINDLWLTTDDIHELLIQMWGHNT